MQPKQIQDAMYRFALTICSMPTAMKFEGFIIIGNPMHHMMSNNNVKNNSMNRPAEEDDDTNALVQELQSGAKKHPLTQMDTTKEVPMTAKLHPLQPLS